MTHAIDVQGISKRYALGSSERYGTLRDTLATALRDPASWFRGRAGTARELWALKDVSFSVEDGEIVGIIGRNGSGKSTLLKILSRITEPTAGRVAVRGRVGSLLEVGTGFHPELTGRENTFLNGAILGMSRSEITRKFDEILAFAEIEQFIDTPVKHYSSGMQMRLAFAVAAHLEPPILLVDEVLAVGDLAFQKKCLGKMGEVARQGRTVLFVSHDLTAVQVLCQRAVRLGHGRLQSVGPVNEEINAYLAESRAAAPCDLDQPLPITDGLDLLRFGFNPNPVPSGSPSTFNMEFRADREFYFDEAAALIHDGLGRRVGVLDLRAPAGRHHIAAGGVLRLTAELSNVPLVEGEYRIGASIRTGDVHMIRYEMTTLDVTAKRGETFVPYRAEIRGLVAFDFNMTASRFDAGPRA
jgi:lipopolysaccharide transport system ATP-binding protein